MSTTAQQPEKGKISLNWADKATGQFRRHDSSFRDTVSSSLPDSKHFAEPGRYHLYVSHACPWAHRAVIVRSLKGLQDAIGVSVVDWLMGVDGWKFSTEQECPGAVSDSIEGSKYIRDLYFKADPEYSGRFTVPVLWDKKLKTIVNNESSEIIRILNYEFNSCAKNPELDLYPVPLRDEIDTVNEWVYDKINNGVYKSGFATKQESYEEHCVKVFQGLDQVESMLNGKKYLVGNQFTEADVRLFTTILRFDPVYHGHFKCNLKTITSGYPNILNWTRRVYQMKGIAETVNMQHIKNHYYQSHIKINPTQIVPMFNGPDLTLPVND